MSLIRRHSLCAILLILFLLPATAACAPAAVEPEAAQTSAPAAQTPSALADSAGGPSPTDVAPTATLPPYPWPTASPGPTDAPEPTEPPEPTELPPPTLPPTPVVTPIPTAEPPFIPFPEGTTPQPFRLYWREGNVIRTMRSDESEPRLFLDPAEEFGLYLPPPEAGIRDWGMASPDGRMMALVLAEEPQPVFVEGVPYPAHIYLLDQETRELRLLVNNGLEPVWSPDGRRLAYRSTETGGLWVAEVESGVTTEVYKVDRANAHNVTAVSWAPDSRWVVILDHVFYVSTELIVADVETQESPRPLISTLDFPRVYAPQWSPKNDNVVYIWDEGGQTGELQLQIINLDGARHSLSAGIRVSGGPPVWSPDGQWLAFTGTVAHEAALFQTDLWLVELASTEATPIRLTYDESYSESEAGANDVMPMWSPDGTQVVFYKDNLVYVLSLVDGSKRTMFVSPNQYDIGLILAY